MNDRNGRLTSEMVRLRYWQHIINEDLKKKLFVIPIHVAFGNEAVAVAINNMMRSDDQLALSHRNIAYNLLRAGSLDRIYEEYKLSPNGIAKGKLGSMNLADHTRGIAYASSILGNNFSVGCGLALAKKVKRDSGIVIVATGDGAIEEGGFYESLVFAKTQCLKLMIVVENNDYSMSSTIAQRRCNLSIESMCNSVGIPYTRLTGNNVFHYAPKFEELRDTVDAGTIPVCVEAELTLLNQHAGPTPGWPTDPMKVDFSTGLIIRNEPADPLYVLRERIGTVEFEKIADEISQLRT